MVANWTAKTFRTKFEELYSTLEVLYECLLWNTSDLKEKKRKAQQLLRNEAIGDEILGKLLSISFDV